MDRPEKVKKALAYSAFCHRLGCLHHMFTAVEVELNLTIYAAVSNLRPKRSALILAVLGGQRMGPAKDTFKRLLRATNASQKKIAFVDAMFLQLGEIQFFRDRLAHHFTGETDDPDVWVNMNFGGIKEPHQMEDIYFHLDTMSHATEDLRWMRGVIGGLFNHRLRRGSSATPELPAWLYKPSMLTRDRPIPKKNHAPRKRPPPKRLR